MNHDTDAEEQILGAMLYSDKAVEKAVDALTEEHFYLRSNGQMFAVMRDIAAAGGGVDTTTVGAALREKGLTEDTGGRIRLHELVGASLSTANVGHHIKIVLDAATKRLVERSITDISSRLETMTAEEAVRTLEETALNVAKKAESKHEVFIDLKRALSEVEQRFDSPLSEDAGVPTPFSFLKPLQGGRMYALAGYQKDGKTIIATQFAAEAAKAGKRVGILSLEMSYSDLTNRWLQQRTGVDAESFRTGRVNVDHLDTARYAMAEMTNWDVKLVDDESITPQAVRKYQRLGKFDLLIIDHLHRMRWKDRHDLEESIKAITNVAREFEVPVILLCQLSRAGDFNKPFPIPTSRQIRETAMLEMDASAIWLIYRMRDDNHLKTSDSRFIVALNRYGKDGEMFTLDFDEAATTFREREW